MKQELSTVAIDLAKKVFHFVGSDTTGEILWRKRLSRYAFILFIAQLPPVLIGFKACGGAHYWAKRLREHGHGVKLMAPQFVKPFVKRSFPPIPLARSPFLQSHRCYPVADIGAGSPSATSAPPPPSPSA